MAAWITVYLRDAAPLPPPTVIRDALASDWWTLGEQYDLDEDAVDALARDSRRRPLATA